MQIAIIIPAHNEETTIKEVIERFHSELPLASIFIIDNKSCDNTFEIATSTMDNLGCQGGVLSEIRLGKGFALRHAFMNVEADYYVMVDADMTYSERDIGKILQPVIDNKCDMCVGDRISNEKYQKTNRRRFHQVGSTFVRSVINILFKSQLTDIMTGYRAFNRQFIKHFPILSTGFEIETEMTLHALDKKFRVMEVPVDYRERPAGSRSKLNTITDGTKVLKTIFWIFKDYKPFVFFSFISLLFLVLGLICGLPPVLEYIKYRWVYRVPLAILSTGLMIFSLLSFAIGLILDTVAKVHKRDYLLKLMNDNSFEHYMKSKMNF